MGRVGRGSDFRFPEEKGKRLGKNIIGGAGLAGRERMRGLRGSSRAYLLGHGLLRGWAASVQFPFSFFPSFFYSFLFS
jgi:hypothetical protein